MSLLLLNFVFFMLNVALYALQFRRAWRDNRRLARLVRTVQVYERMQAERLREREGAQL